MRRTIAIGVLAAGLALGGCDLEAGADDLVEHEEDLDDDLELELGKADGHTMPVRLITGNVALPTALLYDEIHTVFRTEAELEDTLQIPNPGVDFSTEWAVFYNPGLDALEPGSRAWIDTVWLSQTGLTLMVATTLEHNGADCPPRSARPFRLVAVPAPDDPPPYKRFYRGERTRTCGEVHDGVPFTTQQAAAALDAANLASSDELADGGIKGTQAAIIIDGRTWPSLAAIADTYNIGPVTMARLRDLGAAF
jgi:hypothetical protein